MSKKVKLILASFILLSNFTIAFIYVKNIKEKLSSNNFTFELLVQTQIEQDVQFFYKVEGEYSENNSVKRRIRPTDNFQLVTLETRDFGVLTKLSNIRFDFTEDIKLKEVVIKSSEETIVSWTLNDLYLASFDVSESVESISLTDNSVQFVVKKEMAELDPYVMFTPLMYYLANPNFLGITLGSSLLLFLLIQFVFHRSDAKYLYNKYMNSISESVLELAIVLFFITLFIDQLWNSYAIIFLAVVSITTFLRSKRKIVKKPFFMWTFFIVYVMRVVGLIYTPNLEVGIKSLETQFSFVIFPIIFSLIHITSKQYFLLINFYVHLVVIIILGSFISLFFSLNLLEIEFFTYLENSSRGSLLFEWSTYTHPSFIAINCLFSAALVFHFYNIKLIKITEAIFYIVLTYIFIYFSFVRIAHIGFWLLILGQIIYSSINRNSIVKATYILGSITLGILVILSANLSLENIKSIDPERVQMWSSSLEIIKQNLWLGTGTDGYKHLLTSPNLSAKLGYLTPLVFGDPHNQYLSEIMQFGIIGSIFLFAVLFLLLKRGILARDFLFLSFLFIELIFMTTESSLNSSKGITFFMFIVCFLLSTMKFRVCRTLENK